MHWLDITYREFWDVPRIFLTAFDGKTYLFDCPFDENLDDYPGAYSVYEMPDLSDAQRKGSWNQLRNLAVSAVGSVPVEAVTFDATKRLKIDSVIFSTLLAHHSAHLAD